MVYRKKVSFRKKTFRKRNIKKKYSSKKKNLISLIKKVSLKSSETKNTLAILQNQQLYHNVVKVVPNLLYTTTGYTDNQNATSMYNCRVGDQVIARGVSIKLWLANKLDRPYVMYRIFVIKHQSLVDTTTAAIFKSQSGNYIVDDIDTEQYKVVWHKRINVNAPGGLINSSSGGAVVSKEVHKMVSIYIRLNNKKIQYDDAGDRPKFTNYSLVIVPYDSYGTLTTDNICSFAMNLKFYFKDP